MSDTWSRNTIVWDIDGTLLDTAEGLIAAYLYTINSLRLRVASPEELITYIGPTPNAVFGQHFGLSEDAAQHAADIFRDNYKHHHLLKARVYLGIMDVLEEFRMKGHKQGIATNKRQDYAWEICRHFEIDNYCFPICGTDNLSQISKAESITKCLSELDAEPAQAIMIGDAEGDKRAAEQAGTYFLGVNYGYGFQDVPGYANTPKEILDCIERINHDNAAFKQ